MPKPITVPTFDTGGVNMLAPAAGLIASGWTTDEIPTSANHNYLFHWIGQWLSYINIGEWADNLHVTGTLTVDGATTINDSLTVTGDFTVNGMPSFVSTAFFLASINVAEEILRPERRRSFSPKNATFYGTGGGAYAYVAQLETFRLDTAGGKALYTFEEFVPGDRIKEIRLAYTTTGGDPFVRCLLAGAYNYTQIGGNCTQGATENPAGAGTTLVTPYTPNLGPVTLDHKTHGTLTTAFARRFAIEIEATADTYISGIEIVWDHVAIPANDP